MDPRLAYPYNHQSELLASASFKLWTHVWEKSHPHLQLSPSALMCGPQMQAFFRELQHQRLAAQQQHLGRLLLNSPAYIAGTLGGAAGGIGGNCGSSDQSEESEDGNSSCGGGTGSPPSEQSAVAGVCAAGGGRRRSSQSRWSAGPNWGPQQQWNRQQGRGSEHQQQGCQNQPPVAMTAAWLGPERRQAGQGPQGLHEELLLFHQWMSPTPEEAVMRTQVVDRVRRLINQQWPEARLELFGSFRTGLYLPLSDIDLVLFGDWESPPLRRLARLLRESGSCGDIKVLDRASVPIVKATDAVTGLSVDISFNMPNSVRAAGLIQEFVQQFPCLPHLVLVLKQFLLQRNLNEVWTGGISSYSLTLMIVSFLQRHGSDLSRPVAELDLGQLLVEFFELYGCRFDYMSTGIRVKDGGAHLPKEQLLRDMEPGLRPSVLCIEDPLTPGNDIGRSSYGALQVQQAFQSAYWSLSSSVLQLLPQRAGAAAAAYSPLSRIIRVSEDVLRFRAWVQRAFAPPSPPPPPRPASAATAESPNSAAEQPPELLPVSPQPPPPPPRPSYASVAKRPPPPQRRGSGGSSSSVGSAEVIGGGSSEAAQSATSMPALAIASG
ncbi:hypothetical protein BOX15_Mlig031810g1 [Macrostomum lignano]|uniref:polynucleotide adenylyltransferase n=1 Tax=Macrostomum lignano TaxID=282301 RepID=A0A267DYU1_9PLAT|nr:hypothetical protein BOX15_Mlig031810g1 [Macrostomum lignano]